MSLDLFKYYMVKMPEYLITFSNCRQLSVRWRPVLPRLIAAIFISGSVHHDYLGTIRRLSTVD
jgi:hypothetical protein